MKKIAVQTFWTSKYNYGQILQGYALQHFLINNGYDAYIIRFDSFLSRLKELMLVCIRGKLLVNYRNDQLRQFAKFKKGNIRYSQRYYRTFRKLEECPPIADYYIVGSDQVWAYMRNEERRKGYLLCFGHDDVKKLAYAASFGRNNLEENERAIFKDALESFSFVGVREESGMSICKELGVNSHWVIDPVALLSVSQWRKLASLEINISHDNKTIFLYSLTNGLENPSIYNLIDEFSKKYIVYYANSSPQSDPRMNILPSIEEWLSYIDQCDFVVTDSFHCTLFCILLQKKFVTIKRHNGHRMNNRLISLLNRLNLIERYTEASITEIGNIFNTPINWGYVRKELDEWIKESQTLLLSELR